MLLSSRTYDVIISEPSNPWMTGVAALFTREFFAASRQRLRPGGIMCQWTHTYDMSEPDLKSIVATFSSVFPNASLWLIGSDILLTASNSLEPLDLSTAQDAWRRSGVADDLRAASVSDLSALFSLYVAGPAELRAYSAGAIVQNDDRMAIEFSGPVAVDTLASIGNAAHLRQLLNDKTAPLPVRAARTNADAQDWRNRGRLMMVVGDYQAAFEAYSRATDLSPGDTATLEGLVRSAVASQNEDHAQAKFKALIAAGTETTTVWIASSRLFGSRGWTDAAVSAAEQARISAPDDRRSLEQLASIYVDAQDQSHLSEIIPQLAALDHTGRRWRYYAAALSFMKGDLESGANDARAAIAADPGYAAAQNLFGAILASLGRSAEAQAAFEAALRLDPKDSMTYVNMGLLALSEKNRQLAGSYFDEALSLDPKSAIARRGFAEAQ
jgi:tetratricopeptide (TPR) repeat protein